MSWIIRSRVPTIVFAVGLTLAYLPTGANGAIKVAVIDGGEPEPPTLGEIWCSFLNDNGYECTLFPRSGPTSSLDSFAVVIDMSYEWTDSGHLLAQVMQSGRGVITWGNAPDVLGLENDPVVQAWIGASDATFGSDLIETVTEDSILEGVPPGTTIGNSGKFGSRALNNIVGHDNAKVLARHGGGSSSIALLRNQWIGQSLYITDGLLLDDVVGQILLRAVNEFSVRTVPSSSTWGMVVLFLGLLCIGSLRIRRTAGQISVHLRVPISPTILGLAVLLVTEPTGNCGTTCPSDVCIE